MKDALLWTIICLLVLVALLLAPDHLVIPVEGAELTRAPVAVAPAQAVEVGVPRDAPTVLLRDPEIVLRVGG